MVSTGETEPTFTAAYRGGDHEAFDLVNDTSGGAIAACDLSLDVPDLGLYGGANRAVCVPGEDGTVTHSWVVDDPTNEPDYESLLEAVRAV